MAGGRASAFKIKLAERRLLALELRKRGLSYRSISKAILEEYKDIYKKYNYVSAFRDIQLVLADLRKKALDSAEELTQIEHSRLEEMVTAVWDKALDGDLESIKVYLGISKRLSELLGLDKAKSIFGDFENGEKITVVEIIKDHGKSD